MMLTARQITAPVRQRDERIDLLEDLVRDLLVIAPRTCCSRHGAVGAHTFDCVVPRAKRALEETRR